MTEFEVIAEMLVRLYEITETRMKKDRNEELKS